MKKLLLLANLTLFSFLGFSQVTFYVDPPSINAGNYENTYSNGTTWGSPDLTDPTNVVLGELVLAYDDTDSLICSPPIINPTTIAGKIAVIIRGDCEFGSKALAAQVAGAIAVVLINHTGDPDEMNGGSDGLSVTIPVVMISESAGALLMDEIVAGGLTCFIGNKNGYYANDIGLNKADVLRAKAFSNIQDFSQNATEFNIETGALVWNYGSADQTDVELNCIIVINTDTIYNETSMAAPILSGDSLFVGLPIFSKPTYENGFYEMTYKVNYGNSDEFIGDDSITANFMMTDNMWSLATSDATTEKPISNSGYNQGENSLYRACVNFSNPNASRKGISGLTFSATTNVVQDEVHLDSKLVSIEAYKWNPSNADINDADFSGILADNLELLTENDYNYETDLQNVMVSANFKEPFILEDNQHYLFCIISEDFELSIGANTKIDYSANVFPTDSVGTPVTNNGNIISPTNTGESWYSYGAGFDMIAAIGLDLFDPIELGVEDVKNEKINAFPNPAVDMLTIPFANKEGNATINIIDVTGKTVLVKQVNLTGINTLKLDVTSIESGMYVFNVAYENGTTSTFNVVINK